MPEKSAPFLYLALKPSRTLKVLLLVAHALSLLAAWLNTLDSMLRLLLALAVLVSLFVSRGQAEPAYPGISLKPDGSWRLHGREGEAIEANLLGCTVANPWFVMLHFRAEPSHKIHRVLAMRDSLSGGEFRRLSVALKITKIGQEPSMS